MADVFLSFFRSSLPDELAAVLETTIKATESGDFLKVLQLPEAQLLLGREDNEATKDVRRGDFAVWNDYIFRRLGLLLSQQNEVDSGSIQETAAYKQHTYLLIAVAALYAFLQSNVTGPPLPFKSAETLLSEDTKHRATMPRTNYPHQPGHSKEHSGRGVGAPQGQFRSSETAQRVGTQSTRCHL